MAGKRTNRRSKGLVHYIGLGLSAGLLAFVALIAALVVVVPAATGSTPYTILTTSMEPGMPPGTLIIVKPADPQTIQIGDIVTYQIRSGEPEVITHRVVQIVQSTIDGERRFITQGDNNGSPDPEIKPGQIRGVVWYAVPWIGYVNNMVNGDARGVIVPAIAILLFGYAGWMVVGAIRGRARKRRAAERAAERAELQEREARLARIAALEAEQIAQQAGYPAPQQVAAPPYDPWAPPRP
ncbi:MAG TPA: signal peptidase I [Pseudolysinimonas sp.]|nr:signal peptidase I [Pseudolysinimonas sp.]